MDELFASGLRNIRQAIESKLKDSGIQRSTLGDTSRGCVRAVPGMVIIDVGGIIAVLTLISTRRFLDIPKTPPVLAPRAHTSNIYIFHLQLFSVLNYRTYERFWEHGG